MELEKEFCKYVKEHSIKAGFLHYAADDAVLNRDNNIIKGKKDIELYFDKQDLQDILLEWNPDFVDVSQSEDMAYTFGTYKIINQKDSIKKIISNGIFHTVWKRQDDGSWKFVYD